jgi:hypothetical protein
MGSGSGKARFVAADTTICGWWILATTDALGGGPAHMEILQRKNQSPFSALTQPVDARLVLSTGRVEDVTLFLGSRAESHSGPETLDEFLNRQRRFLPVESRETARRFLVNRSSILRIEVDENAPTQSEIELEMAPSVDLVELELTNGARLEGTVCSVQPPDNARLSDYFNEEPAFVPLQVGSGVTYVNKQYVLAVWL